MSSPIVIGENDGHYYFISATNCNHDDNTGTDNRHAGIRDSNGRHDRQSESVGHYIADFIDHVSSADRVAFP